MSSADPSGGRFLSSLRAAGRRAMLFAVMGCCVSCTEETIDDRPERVVEELILRLHAVHGDPARGASALELLAADARENLEQRAARASAASGRRVTAAEMLVPSRFSVRFEPKRFSTEIRGRYSRVTILGDDPTRDLVEVQCTLEDRKWRVMLQLPPLPPIETRERG